MGRVYSTYRGRVEVHAAVGWENLTEMDHLEDLGLGGSTIIQGYS